MINKNNDPRKAMKVPEGFFNAVEDQIMEQVSASKVVALWSVKKLMSIAAVVFLAIACLFIIRMNTQTDTPVYSELSDDLHWDYLFENYEDVTYEDIAGFEETDEAIEEMENELYGSLLDEELLDYIDLETINNLYE